MSDKDAAHGARMAAFSQMAMEGLLSLPDVFIESTALSANTMMVVESELKQRGYKVQWIEGHLRAVKYD